MMLPNAATEFEQALDSARSLVILEARLFRDPPDPTDLSAVQGLRGGATVLMVAALEQLIRQGVEQHLTRLTMPDATVKLETLPMRTRVHSIFASLELAMKGSRYRTRTEKVDRLADIERAAQLILDKIVDPGAFTSITGNPSSERIRNLFRTLDIEDVFASVEPAFIASWGNPIARTFIPDNLDAIVHRRHQVAHTATALTITRVDLEEGLRFIDVLGHVLDDALDQSVSSWIASATSS